jgi:pyruvate, water dikinase
MPIFPSSLAELLPRYGRALGRRRGVAGARFVIALALTACGSSTNNQNIPADAGADADPVLVEWPCEVAADAGPPEFLLKTGCMKDFQQVASEPIDSSIPGARSGKILIDLLDKDTLYFQNSNAYPIHYNFAKAHLNGTGDRAITTIQDFNPQYYLPEAQRRFLLGAVTYYEGPKVWALEIAPYDTSTPAMITKLYNAVKKAAFYGPALAFHPTSEAVEAQAKKLSPDIKIKTTDDLFAAIDYQPLNVGEAVGTLKFVKAVDLRNIYVNVRDVVLLDEVPNDISPTAALITQQFQTPLSHINVLSRNRKTPNMGLRNAVMHPRLVPLKDKQVRITVGLFDWTVAEVSQTESDAWWEAHKPAKVTLPTLNLDVKDLRDIAAVTVHTDTAPYATLADIKEATRAFGAKAANYSVFTTDPEVPNKKAFAIPVVYYHQFMEENGFFARVKAFRDDPEFVGMQAVRDKKLAELRADILKAPFNAEFQAVLKAKLDADFPGKSMRFRSSTNAEDLDGFPCAGCYDSHTGDPKERAYMGDQLAACLDAIRKTWATVFSFRTYEERELRSIDHTGVAMALLVHTNFPEEEANGVAVTNNIFDLSDSSPGFYVNVQKGGTFEVVHPPPGVTSDSFLYQFGFQGMPIIYYTHSNVVGPGETVLSERQIYDLGKALNVIHQRFSNAYKKSQNSWYGMDVEFKFDDEANPGTTPTLYIKQARPYPGPK